MNPKILAVMLVLGLATACLADEVFEVRVLSLNPVEGYVQFPSSATGQAKTVYCAKDVIMDSRNIVSASVSPDQLSDGSYAVQVKIDAQGRAKLLALSQQASEEKPIQMAFLVRGTVITAPVLHGPILTDTFLIQGGYTKEQADAVSKELQPKAPAKRGE